MQICLKLHQKSAFPVTNVRYHKCAGTKMHTSFVCIVHAFNFLAEKKEHLKRVDKLDICLN